MSVPVMDVPQMVLAHDAAIRRINTVLGIADSAELLACPGCGKAVPVAADGSLPPHQIDGSVLGGGRRRTVSVCRYRPEVAR